MTFQRLFFALIGFAVITFSACDDDDTTPILPPDATTYMPLEVGAYWAYETYRIETDGSRTVTSTDTLRVTDSYADGEDTIYEVTKTDGFVFKSILPDRYRLSGGVLYGENNFVLLDVNPDEEDAIIYTDTVAVDLGLITYRYVGEPVVIDVPAGNFECVNFQGTVAATDPEEPINGKFINNYYAEGIGLVQAQNYFWSQAIEVGFRLVAYELP